MLFAPSPDPAIDMHPYYLDSSSLLFAFNRIIIMPGNHLPICIEGNVIVVVYQKVVSRPLAYDECGAGECLLDPDLKVGYHHLASISSMIFGTGRQTRSVHSLPVVTKPDVENVIPVSVNMKPFVYLAGEFNPFTRTRIGTGDKC